jgi:pyruvate formate lyase activating enzyme
LRFPWAFVIPSKSHAIRVQKMVLGGFQKNSLIDYPGRISCVIYLSGCNFTCPYCHNPELVSVKCEKNTRLPEAQFYEFLESRKRFLDGVVISGGEPTLQSGLFGLCERIKQMGYRIKLDTNGSQPGILKQLLQEGLVDYVAMDIKTDPFAYSPLIKKNMDPYEILNSIAIIMERAMAYEFRTTCVRPFVDARIIARVARIIKGALLFCLQGFRGIKVLQPDFFRRIGSGYEKAELYSLRAIAAPWVEQCIVR